MASSELQYHSVEAHLLQCDEALTKHHRTILTLLKIKRYYIIQNSTGHSATYRKHDFLFVINYSDVRIYILLFKR